jgi:hypothetical protein
MRIRNLITVTLIALLLISLAALPAAAQQPQETDSVSFVWFANVGADAPAVDIYFGESTTPVVTNLALGEVSPMFVFPSNQRGFVLREAGSAPDRDPIFTADWGLTPNQSYLILATGLDSKQAFILEPVTLVRTPSQGKAKLRIINTISGDSALTVMDNTDTAIGTSLPYLGVADVDLDTSTSDLTIQNASGEELGTQNTEFKADSIYVALIVGDSNDATSATLHVIEIPAEMTRVKVVNNADANFDVMLNRNDGQEAFAMNLASGDSSDFIEVPSGAATFIVKSAGAGTDGQELASVPIQLRPSRDVTLTIQGSGSQIEIVVTSDVLMEGLTLAGTGTVIEVTETATVEATTGATVPATTTTPAATVAPTSEATVAPTSEVTAEPTTETTVEPTQDVTQEPTVLVPNE